MTWALLVFFSTGVLNLASYPDARQCYSAQNVVQIQMDSRHGAGATQLVICLAVPTPHA
jgi:hypothetical protein